MSKRSAPNDKFTTDSWNESPDCTSENNVFSDLAAWLEKEGLQNSTLYNEVQTAIKNEQLFRKLVAKMTSF
ncbi:MAG: hypothetical protein AAFP70_01020 [Calditrichota bacterium]